MRRFHSLLVAAAMAASFVLPATAAEHTIRLGHAQPTSDIFHQVAERFKAGVEEKTGGKVEVKIFPSGQLGKIRDMVEGLRVGTVQAVIDAPSRLATYTPKADVFKLPYLVKNRAEGEALWQSDAGQRVLDEIADASQIEVVAVAWRGNRHITANREIRKPEDMAGLKIRVPPYDLPIQIFETLGASPTPMSFNEVYLSLQQGVIDAQENPLATNWNNRFQEVTDYLVLTGHIKDFAGILMGQAYLEGLPEDIQAAIRASAKETAAFMGDYVADEEANFIEKFREAGVTVIEPDTEAFRARFDGFVEEYNSDLVPLVEALKTAD